MGITIYAPGIELKITDANKVNFVCNAATSIMDNIFYKDELKNDVITIHNGEGDCIAEIMLRPDPVNGLMKGFVVLNKWYCLPDAKDVARNFIADKAMISGEERK